MKLKFANPSLLFAGVLIIAAPLATARAEAGSVSLTVSVFNDVGASQSVLSEAQVRATYIMRQAGVSLAWLDCGSPGSRQPSAGCSAISFPQHLSVRLVSRASPAREDAFGQSFQNADGEGSYAIVYFHVLASSEAAGAVKTGELLGHVVAHELGHLLLGKDSHSATGLMSAVWRVAELHQASRGNLLFTSGQADRIHSRYLSASGRFEKTSEPSQTASGN